MNHKNDNRLYLSLNQSMFGAFGKIFGVAAFVCLFGVLGADAQQTSQYDSGTAPQHAAGVSSAGSYVSTELGNINLGNGSMNMRLPLGSIGGRGFSIPLTVNYSNKLWSMEQGTEYPSDGPIPRPIQKIAWASYDDPNRIKDVYSDFLPGPSVTPTITATGRIRAEDRAAQPARPMLMQPP